MKHIVIILTLIASALLVPAKVDAQRQFEIEPGALLLSGNNIHLIYSDETGTFVPRVIWFHYRAQNLYICRSYNEKNSAQGSTSQRRSTP
jgi:hypothetical protein